MSFEEEKARREKEALPALKAAQNESSSTDTVVQPIPDRLGNTNTSSTSEVKTPGLAEALAIRTSIWSNGLIEDLLLQRIAGLSISSPAESTIIVTQSNRRPELSGAWNMGGRGGQEVDNARGHSIFLPWAEICLFKRPKESAPQPDTLMGEASYGTQQAPAVLPDSRLTDSQQATTPQPDTSMGEASDAVHEQPAGQIVPPAQLQTTIQAPPAPPLIKNFAGEDWQPMYDRSRPNIVEMGEILEAKGKGKGK